MTTDFEGTQTDARSDWRELATEVAEGAVLPPTALLAAVAEAAGGLPPGVSPRVALQATATLLRFCKSSQERFNV